VKTGFSSLTVSLRELVSEQSKLFGFHHECSLKRRPKRTASVPAIFNQKPACSKISQHNSTDLSIEIIPKPLLIISDQEMNMNHNNL